MCVPDVLVTDTFYLSSCQREMHDLNVCAGFTFLEKRQRGYLSPTSLALPVCKLRVVNADVEQQLTD